MFEIALLFGQVFPKGSIICLAPLFSEWIPTRGCLPLEHVSVGSRPVLQLCLLLQVTHWVWQPWLGKSFPLSVPNCCLPFLLPHCLFSLGYRREKDQSLEALCCVIVVSSKIQNYDLIVCRSLPFGNDCWATFASEIKTSLHQILTHLLLFSSSCENFSMWNENLGEIKLKGLFTVKVPDTKKSLQWLITQSVTFHSL